MAAPVLIVGQGIAGSALGWACEEAGIDFEIADPGHLASASWVGAGILNPVTGRRFAATWRFDPWIPQALACYRAMEQSLGAELIRPMRVYRRFRDPAEKAALAHRLQQGGDSVRHIGRVDAEGVWIEDAWQVDTAAVIAGLRRHWLSTRRLQERSVEPTAEVRQRDVVVLCTGADAATVFAFVPWERAAGEIISGATEDIDPGVILNRGHWALPLAANRVRVGATYALCEGPVGPTLEAQVELVASANELLGGRPFVLTSQEAGVRLGVKDRRPCIGRHPEHPGLGLLSGLGSKGALWAPSLARQWVNHLTEAVPFGADVDVRRFWPGEGVAGRE